MYGALDISTSALVANRVRMTTISANLANRSTITNEFGEYEPFRRRLVEMAAGDPDSGNAMGVHIAAIREDDGPLQAKYEPNSPHADESGYVYYPDIDPVIEQMNAMEAARSYEANIAVIEATKSMMRVALEVLT
ncbi:MAG: flagellar basal body rod protein FlgC [Planctomycetota bacterium]|jgi:flagellar basal-body rod protein FlgC